MNPTQRRGAILLVLAGAGAIAVFVLLRSYVAEISRQVGPTIDGLELVTDVRANEAITPDMVRRTTMPEQWAPPTMMTSTEPLIGQVAGVDLPRGTLLQEGMTIAPPQIGPGERELAILVDAETGVAGKIGPGAIVDIYATFPDSEQRAAQAQILVQNAEVVDVGVARPEAANDGQFTEVEVVPVTFAVSVEESLAIAYAESFSQEVRLGLRAPGDDRVLPERRRVFRARRAARGSSQTTSASSEAPTALPTPGPTASEGTAP